MFWRSADSPRRSGGYFRLQLPLRLALGVRETVAGQRLGALEGAGGGAGVVPPPLSMHPGQGGGSCQQAPPPAEQPRALPLPLGAEPRPPSRPRLAPLAVEAGVYRNACLPPPPPHRPRPPPPPDPDPRPPFPPPPMPGPAQRCSVPHQHPFAPSLLSSKTSRCCGYKRLTPPSRGWAGNPRRLDRHPPANTGGPQGFAYQVSPVRGRCATYRRPPTAAGRPRPRGLDPPPSVSGRPAFRTCPGPVNPPQRLRGWPDAAMPRYDRGRARVLRRRFVCGRRRCPRGESNRTDTGGGTRGRTPESTHRQTD